MKRKNKTIIYVNFSPYENAGKILDFLRTHFQVVILFSFNFHRLGTAKKLSRLSIYRNGRLIKNHYLFDISFHMTQSTVFILIPIRSCINLLQIAWHVMRLKKVYGPYHIYFTVNAFTAWIGNLLKRMHLVDKTVFWVWDYYPPTHPNTIISLVRWLYWQFDINASRSSDTVAFLSSRLAQLRRDINALPHGAINIIPIGTNSAMPQAKKVYSPKIIIGFLGVLKKTQGLDLFFDTATRVHEIFPNLQFEIIGSGPDEVYLKKRASRCPVPVKFYGFIPLYRRVRQIQRRWHIGIAPYMPEESNVSYYTDNSKIKDYLSLGIPVIVTPISFSSEIKQNNAGVVIDYTEKQQFVKAIAKILTNYDAYRDHAMKLAKKYDYRKLYPSLFQ